MTMVNIALFIYSLRADIATRDVIVFTALCATWYVHCVVLPYMALGIAIIVSRPSVRPSVRPPVTLSR